MPFSEVIKDKVQKMAFTQYVDRYIYDKGLNLTNIYHNQDAPQVQGVRLDSNRLSQPHYDTAGNQLGTENLDEIEYNFEGQIALTKKAINEMTVTEYYIYAAPGHRVKKVTETVTSDVVTGIDIVCYVGDVEYRTNYTGTDLFYDGEEVTGTIIAIQDSVETRIKSGHGQVAKMTENSQSQSTSYSYNLINNIDSNSVEVNSDSNIMSYQNFYPYGGEASTQGNTDSKQLGFSGQELDSTSLNDYGFRYFNSKAGRWTRSDPIGFRSGQLNLYAMVGGNPVANRDFFGLMTKGDQLLVAGYVRKNFEKQNVNEFILNLIASYYYGTTYTKMLDHAVEVLNNYKNISISHTILTSRINYINNVTGDIENYKEHHNLQTIDMFKNILSYSPKRFSVYLRDQKTGDHIFDVADYEVKEKNAGLIKASKDMYKQIVYKNNIFSKKAFSRISFSMSYDAKSLEKMIKILAETKWIKTFKVAPLPYLHLRRDSIVAYLDENNELEMKNHMDNLKIKITRNNIKMNEKGPLLMMKHSKGLYYVRGSGEKSYAELLKHEIFKNIKYPYTYKKIDDMLKNKYINKDKTLTFKEAFSLHKKK